MVFFFFFPQPSRVSFTSGKVRLPAVTSCDDRTTHSAPLSFNFLLSPKVRFSCAPSGTGRCFAVNGRSRVTHLVSLGKDSLTLSPFLVFALRGGRGIFGDVSAAAEPSAHISRRLVTDGKGAAALQELLKEPVMVVGVGGRGGAL